MDKTTQPTIRKKKKTLNACQRCRSRKIKCSGQDPCQHCVSRRFTCVFEDRPKKLIVSEDYLNELQNRASAFASRGLPEQPSTPLKPSTSIMPDPADAHQRQHQHSSPHFSPSAKRQQSITANGASIPRLPYDGTRPDILSSRAAEEENSEDRQIYVESQHAIGDEYRRLGHSSSWAFSRKIRNMINDVITGGSPLHDAVPILDGAYGVPWRPHPIDFSGLELPMEDYAEYLTNTVSFTLDPLYYLFNKQSFLSKLRQFYADRAAGKDRSKELWLIQMLVVFAFGKSILAREAGSSGPAGALYFARAVEALPDSHRLYEEPILSIEILCMFALFMQAMDMRFAAYEYIGRAVRMCLTHGLNRRFDANRITKHEFDHRSRIWWSVYIIERRLCSLCGVPSSLHDEDIALSMPSIGGVDNQTIAFHVEISSQLGQILNVVYGLGLQRQLGGRFIAEIQSILHRLADTSAMLNTSMKIELYRPTDTISRAAASLHLLHHQCSILAIRPILFFLLQKKLTTSDSTLVLSDAVIGLLRVCVESALRVLKIIESLSNHKLIDLLLPFDLDAMFASAFVLVLIGIITPADAEQWDLSRTLQLMDGMMMRGIITAGPYKKDLIELSNLGQSLRNSQQRDLSHQHQHQSLQQNQGAASATPQVAVIPDSRPDVELNPQLEQDQIWSWMATDSSGLGVLQPSTIQSAIDGLNFDFLNDSSALEMDGCDWMWGSGGSNWADTL